MREAIMNSSQPTFRALGFICVLAWLNTGLAQEYQAGFSRIDITPTAPVHLGGYASRTVPFKGIAERIYAKGLALRDSTGQTTLLVTADTIGTPRWFNDRLAERINQELSIPRERFLFACSHSHSTPAIKGALDIAYGLTGEALSGVEKYSNFFLEQSFAAAKAALTNLEPVTLSFGRGEAHFAMNRRQFGKDGVFIGVNPLGLVDNDVPVIRAAKTNGITRAIVVGYACHCTTPGANDDVTGDWAGYAAEHLETAYPGATVFFITGCGADANPEPRGELGYARQHGLALAGAVARALNEPMVTVSGRIRAAFERVDLPLGTMPTREQWQARLTNSSPATVRHAKVFLEKLDAGEKLPASCSCPVQVLRFGDALDLVALGGEVVVDYSYRLKRELPGEHLWTASYCNDVFAYVPSVRVLIEGGYEADANLVYYAVPTRFAPQTEDLLVGRVVSMVKQLRTAQ